MNHTPIPSQALYQEVAERLRSAIFAHQLPPGSWIDEQALVEQYGISRTPLREALKVLAAEGLITLKPRRGSFVTEVSERDLDEIFAILALLEGECTRLASTLCSPRELTGLEAIHAELENAAASVDIDRFFNANQRFHQALQELAGSHWLRHVIQDLRKLIKLSRHHSLFSDGRLEQALAEHRLILAALRDGDSEAAAAAMRAHINNGRAAVARLARAPQLDSATA